uniref:Uncharacterized protein n=1 Tax=Arundo donax TaxID=35708 RepID=A0A0A9HNR1_ARUDO
MSQYFMTLTTGVDDASFAVRGATPTPTSPKYCALVSTMRMASAEKYTGTGPNRNRTNQWSFISRCLPIPPTYLSIHLISHPISGCSLHLSTIRNQEEQRHHASEQEDDGGSLFLASSYPSVRPSGRLFLLKPVVTRE